MITTMGLLGLLGLLFGLLDEAQSAEDRKGEGRGSWFWTEPLRGTDEPIAWWRRRGIGGGSLCFYGGRRLLTRRLGRQ